MPPSGYFVKTLPSYWNSGHVQICIRTHAQYFSRQKEVWHFSLSVDTTYVWNEIPRWERPQRDGHDTTSNPEGFRKLWSISKKDFRESSGRRHVLTRDFQFQVSKGFTSVFESNDTSTSTACVPSCFSPKRIECLVFSLSILIADPHFGSSQDFQRNVTICTLTLTLKRNGKVLELLNV